MNSLELAKYYFELSNNSDFEEITKLFDERSTFRSAKGELFLGVDDIMAMQRIHHGLFIKPNWIVNKVSESKPGVIRFDFDFSGETHSGDVVEYSGIEDVVIYKGKIQHIQVERI